MANESKLENLREKFIADVDNAALMLEVLYLLNEIWLEYGPYRNGEISRDTWNRVNALMDFDDSE